MTSKYRRILAVGWAIGLAAGVASQSAAPTTCCSSRPATPTRPPIGWVEFCADHPIECKVTPSAPRDVVLSNKAWTDLVRINKWVNENVKPMTDMDHWGVVEKWSYPDDGYGDCEDYALLKRRMLMEAGWPREALLMTVVREKNGNGHAVLTVKTDKGEFILDNQEEQHPALVGDELPLREAAVAVRSQPLGLARRPAPDHRHGVIALRQRGI